VPLAFISFIGSAAVGFSQTQSFDVRDKFLAAITGGVTNPLVWLGIWAANCRINRYQCPHCAAWIVRGKEAAAGELIDCSDCKKSLIKPPAW
jgi:hypothetical protein